MSIKELARKVFLVDLIKGLAVTFMYQGPKSVYTEQYPLERPQVAERYRGAPRLNVSMLFNRQPPMSACTGPRASAANFLPRPKGNAYVQLSATLWRISKSEFPR